MIQVGALSVRFLVESADSNGSASVFECFVPANSKMPAPHSHDAFEETIYELEGITTVDGRTLDVRPGEAFCVPRGAVQDSTITGPKTPSSLRYPAPASCRRTTSVRFTRCWSQPQGAARHGEGGGGHAPARPNAGATRQLTRLERSTRSSLSVRWSGVGSRRVRSPNARVAQARDRSSACVARGAVGAVAGRMEGRTLANPPRFRSDGSCAEFRVVRRSIATSELRRSRSRLSPQEER
jgi:hypothetical protein